MRENILSQRMTFKFSGDRTETAVFRLTKHSSSQAAYQGKQYKWLTIFQSYQNIRVLVRIDIPACKPGLWSLTTLSCTESVRCNNCSRSRPNLCSLTMDTFESSSHNQEIFASHGLEYLSSHSPEPQ